MCWVFLLSGQDVQFLSIQFSLGHIETIMSLFMVICSRYCHLPAHATINIQLHQPRKQNFSCRQVWFSTLLSSILLYSPVYFKPIALSTAKTPHTFCHSECNMVYFGLLKVYTHISPFFIFFFSKKIFQDFLFAEHRRPSNMVTTLKERICS